MQMKPSFSIKGNFHFRPVNAFDAPAYFYQDYRVYRFDGRQMVNAGILYEKAKLEHSAVSFHPDISVAAFHDSNDVLTMGDFEGNVLWQGVDRCQSSLISTAGDWVWAASRIDERSLKILLYNCRDGEVITTRDFPDELYKSHVTLSDIPQSRAVTMQLAAGQDGIAVHRLDYDGSAIRAKELFPNACYATPVWKPDGTSLLTLENDENTLACFSYPQLEKVAEELQQEFTTEELWDNANGYYQVYLEDSGAIVQTNNNRFYLYSPQRMKRIEELVITGFAPRPTRKIFPNLEDDESPYCELACLERLGRYIVAHTWRRGEGATQDLLLFQETELMDAINAELQGLA